MENTTYMIGACIYIKQNPILKKSYLNILYLFSIAILCSINLARAI